LIDALGVGTFDVVGESFGGAITAELALSATPRVRKAIFMDAQIYPQEIPMQAIAKAPLGIGRALTWNSLGGGPFGFAAQRCAKGGDCRWLELSKIAGTVDTFQAINRSDRGDREFYKRVPDIAVPALVIWGSEDTIVPVANGDRLARELQSPFVLISGAGHVPYWEQPDKVAERVLAFLDAGH
jgi:pimeloyl-ACP methyl ester carboxylesterase